MACSHLYIELLPQSLGAASYQFPDVADKLADKIGNASGGIRHVLAALEDGNPKIGITPASLRGGAHAGAITSDYHQSLMRHSDKPPF
jgi:hypothetical protein